MRRLQARYSLPDLASLLARDHSPVYDGHHGPGHGPDALAPTAIPQ